MRLLYQIDKVFILFWILELLVKLIKNMQKMYGILFLMKNLGDYHDLYA